MHLNIMIAINSPEPPNIDRLIVLILIELIPGTEPTLLAHPALDIHVTRSHRNLVILKLRTCFVFFIAFVRHFLVDFV